MGALPAEKRKKVPELAFHVQIDATLKSDKIP
jgi:hypothetical protein